MITSRKTRHVVRWTLDLPADLAERVEKLAGMTAPSQQEWLIWAVTCLVTSEEARWAIPERAQEGTK